MFDVIALGELLIDFNKNTNESKPGGAPCNVLAMLSKLGKKTSFVGMVGNDADGDYLVKTISSIGIDVSNVKKHPTVPTTKAIVFNNEKGERTFEFIRNPGADMMLSIENINLDNISNTKIFHFGTLSMTHKEVRNATKMAVLKAKENGTIISFDPNIREPLWNCLDEAKLQTSFGLENADIVKMSMEELNWFTEERIFGKAVKEVIAKYKIKLMLITCGERGCIAIYKKLFIVDPGFPNQNPIDTTGAGDTFMGCVLNYVLEHDLDNLSADQIREMLRFANAAASIVVTRIGALTSMPTKEEILNIIK